MSVNIDWMQFNGFKNVVSAERTEATAADNRLRGIENTLLTARNNIIGNNVAIRAADTRITQEATRIDGELTFLSNVIVGIADEIGFV